VEVLQGMDWVDKRVSVELSKERSKWVEKRLHEEGAIVVKEDIQQDSIDLHVVPMGKGVGIISYAEAVVDLLDTDFNPAWVSTGNLKPSVFTYIILPEYCKEANKCTATDISWAEMQEIADCTGIPVGEGEEGKKGNLLVVLPNKVHVNNMQYVRHWFQHRAEHNNISYITMRDLQVAFREWKLLHGEKVQKKVVDVSRQKRFMESKWLECKKHIQTPYRNFSEGKGKPEKYVVIDTEYKPISPQLTYPVLTEIGMVKVENGKIVDKYHKYVRNDMFLVSHMKKYKKVTMTGANVITVDRLLKELLEFVGDYQVVGHQIGTDMLVLSMNLCQMFDWKCWDTLTLCLSELDEDYGTVALPKLADILGLHKNPHCALDDAITTYELFEYIGQKAKERK
jgi:DNA polymerase III epsilon subunit-like protein